MALTRSPPARGAALHAGNYNITYANGTLTINPAIFYWIYYGSGIGDGTDPENWSPDQVPGANDVIIYPSGTGNCDMTGFGDGFTVAGCTTLVGYSTMIMLPTDFNVGASGLQMNSGSIQVDASAFLRGASTWTGGNLLSSSPTAANLDLLANFLVPAPQFNPTQIKVPMSNETNLIVENNEIATVDSTQDAVNITFAKNAGVMVKTGGIFEFTGENNITLGVALQQSGAFVLDGGDCWVDMDEDAEVQVYLAFQQKGTTPQTIVMSGKLSLQENDANGYVAEITTGTVQVYGDAVLKVSGGLGASKGIFFGTGSTLIAMNSDIESPATLIGNVVVDEGAIVEFGGNTQGYGDMLITGDFNMNGTLYAAVDFDEIPQTCDRIYVNGTTTLGNKSKLVVLVAGTFAKNETFIAIENGMGLTNKFNTEDLPNGFTTNYTATDLELKT